MFRVLHQRLLPQHFRVFGLPQVQKTQCSVIQRIRRVGGSLRSLARIRRTAGLPVYSGQRFLYVFRQLPPVFRTNSQAAGKQFLTWLYTSETGKSYLYDQFGFVPVIKGDVNENLDVLSQDMQKYVEAGKTIGWNMAKWPANSINVYFAPLAQEFFTSDMSADDFLAGLDKAYADAIANQDK